jgi:hypothetical protein
MNGSIKTKDDWQAEIKRALLLVHDFEKWAIENEVEMVTPYQQYDRLFDAWVDAALGLGALWHILEWHDTKEYNDAADGMVEL